MAKNNRQNLIFKVKFESQKSQNLDIQSQFFMSKIIRNFLKKFFIEEYHFRGTFFVIDIF